MPQKWMTKHMARTPDLRYTSALEIRCLSVDKMGKKSRKDDEIIFSKKIGDLMAMFPSAPRDSLKPVENVRRCNNA